MRRSMAVAVALAFCSASGAVNLRAWGPSGHRIVAMVAKAHLPSTTAAKVSSLLGGQSMANVANWADVVRDSRPETANWHFVDIPKSQSNYVPSRDCKASPEGDCVIAALDRFKAQLSNTALTKAKRAEALKFIIHFIGDLHQPMHCADDNDRGGNAVKVLFFGKKSNLHRVWDSGIIEHAEMTEKAFADDLLNSIVTSKIPQMQAGTVVDWALAAHALAVDPAYKIPTNKQLRDEYYGDTWETVDSQLTLAGLRLVKVLVDALGQ